jgi:3D (Asp-Asp-Asp) domain-containing protein
MMQRRFARWFGVAAALFAPACGPSSPPEEAGFTPEEFVATAYCLEGITQSGVRVQPGIVAADPAVLPVGSVVRIEEPADHAGIYTVLDTGGAIKGDRLDIYLPDCGDAQEFGRQPVSVRVLRYGWDPQAVEAAPSAGEAEE